MNLTEPITINVNLNIGPSLLSPSMLREELLPKILKELEANTRGYAENLTRILRDRLDGAQQ